MNFTSKEKSAIITILSSIMKADEQEDPREQDFLDGIFRKFGITIDEYTVAAHMQKEECKAIMDQMEKEKRDMVSKYFLDMVGVDGRVDLRELRVLHGLI